MLHLQNRRIAVVQSGSKATVKALFPARRINQKNLRRFQHHCRAKVTIHQPQPEVGPGHQSARRDNIALINDQTVDIQHDFWKAAAERFGIGPVSGCRATVQEPGFGQKKCSCANRS